MTDKIALTLKQLTLRDLRRARVALGGRDPFEIMGGGDQLEMAQLIGYCLRSRDDPEYSWEDAEQMEIDEFAWIGDDDDEPPPTGSSDEPGEPSAPPAPRRSKSRPPAPEPNSSSETSSG